MQKGRTSLRPFRIFGPAAPQLRIALATSRDRDYTVFKISDCSSEWVPWVPALFFDHLDPTDANTVTQEAAHADDSAAADRLVKEEGLDARVAEVVAPVLEDLGFRLVRARMFDHNGLTMQIMAERPDGTISVNDCELISRELSPVLDVEDPVSQAYSLEVSSPGIDRPLVRRSDFATWSGHVAKVEAAYLVEGRKRWRGQIIGLEDDKLIMKRDNAAKGEESRAEIPLDAIIGASLVLTDELITEALKRDKSLRQANNIEDAPGEDN